MSLRSCNDQFRNFVRCDKSKESDLSAALKRNFWSIRMSLKPYRRKNFQVFPEFQSRFEPFLAGWNAQEMDNDGGFSGCSFQLFVILICGLLRKRILLTVHFTL